MNKQTLDDTRYEIRSNSGDVGIRVAFAYLYVFNNEKSEIRFIKDISGLSSRDEAILFSEATTIKLSQKLSQNSDKEEIFAEITSGNLATKFLSLKI